MKKQRITAILLAAMLALPTPLHAQTPDDDQALTESESDSESNGVGTGSSETQSGETGSSKTNGGGAGSSETEGGDELDGADGTYGISTFADDDELTPENTVSFTYTDAKTWYELNVTAGNVWCDDSEYQAAENGIFITGIENAGENVVIPTTIDGYPVTGIAPSAFADCTQIKSVAVEDSEESQLTYILKKAFEGCTSLETVSLAKALRCVDGAAFNGCTSLREFIADWTPLSDEELSERGEMYVAVDAEGVLFTLGGKRLTKYPAARSAASYDIPEGTVVLGGSSFSGAANLTNVTIPDTLRELNVVCFQSSGLTSIVLPSTVVRIDGGAFDNCTSLESIEVQSADTNTDDFGNINVDTKIICHRGSSAAIIAESKELTTIFYDYPYSISELAGYRGYSVAAPEKSAYISPDMIDIPALTDGVSGTVYTGEPIVIDTYENIHLTGIRILPDPNDPSAVGGTVVEGSNDNESWSEVYTFESSNGLGIYYVDLDSDVQENYRYFRVSRDGGLDISELELWYEYYRETVDGLTYTFELRNDGSGVNIKDVYAEEGFDSNSIVIPETLGGQPVRRINYGTFAGLGDVADTITSITLPSTLTECGASFEWLNNITEVNVADGNKYFASVDNVLYWNESGNNDGDYCLVFYPTGDTNTVFNIPEKINNHYVTSVGEHAFSDSSVTEVDATYIREIRFKAFFGCNVETITTSTALKEIGPEAFRENHKLSDFYVPAYDVRVYQNPDCRTFESQTVIHCHKGSEADELAQDEKLETVYYTQSYPHSTSEAATAAGVALEAPTGSTVISADIINNSELTDGNYTTLSNGDVYIDAESPVHLSEIRILPDVYESWNIIGIKIQASLDNSSWKTIYEFEDKDYNGAQIYCADLAESNLNKFQYYRIVTNGKNIAELELWYDDNGVDLPANSEDYFILADAESWYYNNVTTGDVWCDDTNYLASAENGLFITGVFNAGEEVVIPSYIGGRPVTGIAPYAFAGCDQIKSIKVDDSENSPLTYILRNAFSSCTNLESVSFAKALRCVDGAAFEGCESLLEFRGDWKPFTDEEIEARDNRYVVVHEGVLYTFGGTRLTKYPVARSDSYYSVLDGTTAIGGYAFSGAEALKKVDLPQSVAELNDSCFMESGFESITLPYSLRSIDCKAFKNCTNLTKVVSLNNNENLVLDKFANTEEDCIFYGTNPDLEVIAYAGGPEEEYCEEHGINFTASTSVVWFTGRDEINYYDYADNEVIITGVLAPYGETISSVPSVTQDGKTVVGIGDYAFTDNSAIGGDFKLPDTIRFIMSRAFSGTSIKSLTIPKNLVNIWEGALADCQLLTRFTVDPANPYYHTDNYYSENSGIGLYRVGKPEDINDSTFVAYAMGCENESYTLPEEVFEIGIASFVGAEKLKTLELGNTLGNIRGDAFGNYEYDHNTDKWVYVKKCGIERLELPFFTGCDDTGILNCPDVTVVREDIGDGKFLLRRLFDGTICLVSAAGFSGEVEIPEGVEIIYSGAFNRDGAPGNNGVTDIYLPSSLRIIESEAFNGCGSATIHGGIYQFEYDTSNTRIVFADPVDVDGLLYRYDEERLIASVIGVSDSYDGDTELVIPESISIDGKDYTVKAIGAFAFATPGNDAMPRFTSVVIPDSVTHIGACAFDWQDDIKTVRLSNSLESLGWSIFNGCIDLLEYTMDETDSARFKVYENNGAMALYDTERKILSNYTRGSDALTFTMPSDMKQVEDYAFAYSKLRSVTIPEGVVKLGNNIFAYSENLTSVNLPATLLETGMAFTYCPSLMEINVASGSFNHRTIDGALYRYRYNEEDNINILVAFPEGRTEQLSGGIYRIADNTEEIYDGAFNGNSKLNGVIIPNTVKRIGNWVLGGAENVKTLIIPDGCEVSWGAFEGSSLDSIYIQDKNLIENFENQTENIEVYANKSEYESALLNDTLNIVDGVLLSYTGSFDTIDLSSFTDITAIGENVFDGVNAEIILPDSIKSVGYRAFADNPQITGELIYQLLENGAYIERHAFENCTGVTELVIPAVTNDINPGALTRLPNLRSITVEDENDSFIAHDSRALYTSDGKRLLTAAVGDGKVSLEFSDGLERIDRDALYGYSSLMGTLSIPSTVTEIGDAAFAGLSQIENFAITGGESAGGFYTDEVDEAVKPTALYQDTTLMYYPAGHRATSYEVLDGTTVIGSYAFSENKKLTEVVLPNSVNVISDHAFKRCTRLRSINLPDSLTEIREYAFELCTSLISAQIPESIGTIRDGVFVNCSALLNVSMPGVTTVNNIAFAGCKNLTKVDMPAAVDVRVSSFADCVQLSSALFGENVPDIHPTSFTNCDKIVVYYPEGAWSNAVIDGFFGNFIAKPYAIENLTKSDAQSSVTVAFAPDSTEDAESISVSVTTTSANTAEALNSVASDAVADTEESAAYNITLSSSDSTVTELDKPVLVKIPLPEGFTAEQKAKLVIIHEHISSDGTTENSIIADYFFVTEEDGSEYVCFRMNRFSTVKLTGVEETVHNHVYNQKHNDYYHWNECNCGVEIDKEPHDKTLRFDKAEHWYECEVCGYKSEREAHAPTVVGKVSPTYDSVGYTGDTVCADCGYVISVGTVIPELTYPIIIPPVDNGSGESSGTDETETGESSETGESETGESSGTGGTEAPVVSDWENPFTDVSESDSFYDAVRFANENKLLIGVSDTEFGPSLTMNRAMFITVLGRADRVPENTIYSGSFEDVDEISWYSAYVSWAHENGIVKGYSDLAFGPFDCVTIEQSCVILARYAEYLGEDISVVRLGEDSGFDDISKISDWAADGVAWAVRNGIYNADGNSLRPDAPATRAEVAVMIYRLSEYFAANAN